jgi:hypothetical protein
VDREVRQLPRTLLAVLTAGSLASACACTTASPKTPPEGSTPPQKPAQFVPQTIYSGGDGSSIEQAVVVMADDEDQGVDREHRWIFERYGKFRKTGVGLATVGQRKYDVVRVVFPDGTEKEIFFDITSFFGKSANK